jgi:hypothetical protein
MMACTAGGKEKEGDERRQQDQRKVTSLSVGQGEPPAGVINSYSQLGKNFLSQDFAQKTQSRQRTDIFTINSVSLCVRRGLCMR